MTTDPQLYCVLPTESLLESVRKMDAGGHQFIAVCDSEGRLLGTITDGDVRRALLKGTQMDQPCSAVMHSTPKVCRREENFEVRRERMRNHGVRQLPVLDDQGKLVAIEFLDEVEVQHHDNPVVLMAGGSGVRLRPLTDQLPKPMLEVGDRPILETIVTTFAKQGFRDLWISLNYRGDLIESYFGDGSKYGVSIRYLREDQRLGTAGALALLPEPPKKTVLVMNADLLTQINFSSLLRFHTEHRAAATMCVKEYDFQVPYGVVKLEGVSIADIEEKPVHNFFVNAGIYCLSPSLWESFTPGTPMDMTRVFEAARQRRLKTIAFPIREYWLDIGKMPDFVRANQEYPTVFGPPSEAWN